MDKLQPIIKHHFWIVFLIALALPPVAWWMTTGELAAEISDRTSSLESTFSGIANGQNTPNDDWTNGVKQRITVRTEANRLALKRLWKAQTDLMVWPPNVAKWMDVCPYRGELDDVRIKQILPDIYRGDYELAVRRVWLISEPIDDGKTRVDPELKQKVVFPYQSLPRIDAAKWSALPPTWQEIWNAQEDLWLLSEVLSAVRRTNDSTSSITDSYVKQILQLDLFGGKRAAAPSSGSTGSTSGFPGGGAGFPGTMAGSTLVRGGGTALSKPAEFPISEEYELTNAGPRGSASYMQSGGAASSASASVDPNSDESRYIQTEDAYRTRLFKLKVVVDQMQVPTLIRELLNSPYPIEVIRFQQSAMNPEEPGKPAANRSGYQGGNSLAGMTSEYSGEGDDSGYLEEDEKFEDYSSTDDSNGFEGESEGSGSGTGAGYAAGYAIPAIANVQAALEDRDLVELVVIGEIYIYNPPAVDDSEQIADAASVSGTVQTPIADVDGPAVSVNTTDATPPLPTVAAEPVQTPSALSSEASDTVPAATPEGTDPTTNSGNTADQQKPAVPAPETVSAEAETQPEDTASEPSTSAPLPATDSQTP